jgi:hypothetical protein
MGSMLTKRIALKISLVVLFLAGLMDIKRGFAHTFNVRYSAEHLEHLPDYQFDLLFV